MDFCISFLDVFTSRYTSYTCSLVSVSFNMVHRKPPFCMKESMCLSFAGVNPLMFGTANMSTLTRLPALIHCMIPHVLLHGQLCCRTTNAGTWAWQSCIDGEKSSPKKTAPKKKHLCHDSMTQWLMVGRKISPDSETTCTEDHWDQKRKNSIWTHEWPKHKTIPEQKTGETFHHWRIPYVNRSALKLKPPEV